MSAKWPNEICIVIGNKPESTIRQLNKFAKEKYGEDYGYLAKKLKTIDKQTSLWSIN